ncbi:MAG: glycosyltransferase family 2 protein [Geobacteraceae bacterium]|nr:glycosyltransferase family 2 protein [Geobacteraceae bacterium]
MKISVVMPVYNERQTIHKILEKVQQVGLEKEIIIVDDCSTDGTRECLENLKNDAVKVVYHDRNKGKGAALQTGFNHVSGDIVIIQDADLEYDPNEYHRLIGPIVSGQADVVYGSRFLSGSERRVLFFWHYVGNKFLTLVSNVITNLNLSDMETCYKVFRSDILKKIRIEQNRFGFEPEFTVKIAKKKLRIYEVGISYYGRDYAEGKKIGWKDGVVALWCLVKYSFLCKN